MMPLHSPTCFRCHSVQDMNFRALVRQRYELAFSFVAAGEYAAVRTVIRTEPTQSAVPL